MYSTTAMALEFLAGVLAGTLTTCLYFNTRKPKRDSRGRFTK